jgi:hypothetical protein
MLAYVFWHTPLAGLDAREYETPLLEFHADLARNPPTGLVTSAAYRVSGLPWLGGRPGYEDWCLLTSSAALDGLNKAAITPERWGVHAAIASKTDFGHGGLYYHLHGEEQPIAGARVFWLRRPRGIRYEEPLEAMIKGAAGFLSCWRKLMVLGPGEEFAIVGSSRLEVAIPEGWKCLAVERNLLGPQPIPPRTAGP